MHPDLNSLLLLSDLILIGFLIISIHSFLVIFLKKREIPHDLGDRMKFYEEESRTIADISPDREFLVRMDGRAFSALTSKYKKIAKEQNGIPYSKEFRNAMLLTANDLLREFHCSTVYTHSDEITLVFSSLSTEQGQHIFGGRTFKLLSIIPSFASSVFMCHFAEELLKIGVKFASDVSETNTETATDALTHKICNGTKLHSTPTFDARIIVFPEHHEYEILNYLIWRSKWDCVRNFVSLYAQAYLKGSTEGIPTSERIKKLKEIGHDLDSETTDFAMKHGVFLKCFDRKTVFHVFKNIGFSTELLDFLIRKESHTIPENTNVIKYTSNEYRSLFSCA